VTDGFLHILLVSFSFVGILQNKGETKMKRKLGIALGFLAAFILWTLAVSCLDVQAIGPRDSAVGFATINGWFHSLTGVDMTLYTITDWLGLVPVAFGFGFAILGLVQWIKRRRIRRVDRSILVLGGFYVAVIAAYLLFEELAVNYRPVLINGCLEASYPSSTTLLALCVMLTAAMELWGRIRNTALRGAVTAVILIFTAFMVIGRLLSGVHWLTDIVGGILLSGGLVTGYWAVSG
jgi:undecaprenyl-diphosphatase